MDGNMKHFALILLGLFCCTGLVLAQVEWQEYILSTQHDGPSDVYVADVNDDGNTDILGTSRYDGVLAYWEKVGDEWVETTIASGLLFAMSPITADVNNDGVTDVLACELDGDAIHWWEREGDTWIQHTIATGADGAAELAIADINQDGLLDLYAVLYYGAQVVWYEQTVAGWDLHIIRSGYNYCNQIEAADVDNDGDMDCVACAYSESIFTWYENDGGVFQEHYIDSDASGAWSVDALDFDDDGDVDVVGGLYSGGRVNWYENTDNSWTLHTIASGLANVRDAQAADFDIDGDMDVLVATSGNSAVYWYENDGGVFTQHSLRTDYDYAWHIHAGDVDDDGDFDAVGAAQGLNLNHDEFTLWEQLGTPIPEPIDIDLHPVTTVVPPEGGTISYGATLYNTTPQPWSLDAWTGVELPNGQVFEPLMRTRGTLPVGTFELFNLMFNVPADAPSGTYIFTGYLGRINQGLIAAQDSFTFTKTGAITGTADPTSWFISPWIITDKSSADLIADQPTEFLLAPAHPNPFNETTTLSVNLPGTANLNLAVYTTTGRLVAQIATGTHTAGTHRFSFDGSGLATGMYFIQAEAPGELKQMQKVLLLK
jgi:FG-GAP-like repeat/Secretion system C-terminal sorting domain